MTNILILDAQGQIAGVATDLFTILRPAWLNDRDEIAYATRKKGEAVQNASAQVSRKSVAALLVKLAMTSGLEIHNSLGVPKAF